MTRMLSLLILSFFITSNALAQWKLVNEESSLNFISVKKSKVAETHYFKAIEGSVDDSGNISVDVDLSSAETNIAIRNDRLSSMLFEVSKFPKANITASIDPKTLSSLKVGDSVIQAMSFNVSLHGVENTIKTKVRIIKLNNNKILVFSVTPIIIDASKYKLTEGIEMLRKAAKLPSISPVSPVSFSFMFQQ